MPSITSHRLICIRLLIVFFSFASCKASASETDANTETQPLKVLRVVSYNAEWQWNVNQFNGFMDALEGIDIDYKIYEMDSKRRSSPEAIEQSAQEAIRLIDSWKPDLIYTNDDNAQKYVARHYVNSKVPIVFSGVNANPADYDFIGSSNVTGVTEVEHPFQTFNLLKMLVPGVKSIALIIDKCTTWPSVVERTKLAADLLPSLEIVAVHEVGTFEQYQQLLTEKNDIDAFGLLGVFGFVDESGNEIPYEQVLEWTAKHSDKPDFSFWGDRVELGTLVAVTVSGYDQGLEAGKKARLILDQGLSPADIPIESTARGEPALSLARANTLGLHVPSSILLNSNVSSEYQWEK